MAPVGIQLDREAKSTNCTDEVGQRRVQCRFTTGDDHRIEQTDTGSEEGEHLFCGNLCGTANTWHAGNEFSVVTVVAVPVAPLRKQYAGDALRKVDKRTLYHTTDYHTTSLPKPSGTR